MATYFSSRLRRWLDAAGIVGVLVLLSSPGRSAAVRELDWVSVPGFRRDAVTAANTGRTGFSLLPASVTGVRFTNFVSPDRHLTNQILLNGSGVAAGDIDGDGWCDLYFCGLDGPNALYRNLGGFAFQDIADAAGVACPGLDATGAALADLDGDGDLDLVVNSIGGGTRLYFNDGRGRFTEPAGRHPLNPGLGGMSLALADIDGDRDLDLYVANYRAVTIRDQPNTRFTLREVDGRPQVVAINGRPASASDLAHRFTFRVTEGPGGGTFAYDENGEPDVLLRNDGAGRFIPLSWTNGTFLDNVGRPLANPPFDWGLSVMFRDLNGDGAPDLYVCNDFKSPDRIWINDGRGRFRPIAPLALRQTCLSSMGVDFADLNRDGFDDFLVVDMLSRDHLRRFTQRIDIKPEVLPIGALDNRPQYPRNTLYLNRGDGTWAECAQFSGLEATEWSWTPIFLDVDLDGYEDLLVSNGFERDGMNVDTLARLEQMKKEKALPSEEQLRLRRIFPRLDTANLAFHNTGNLRFHEISAAWGFDARGISQGMCLADLDNDGDLDVVINNMNGPASIYRNETAAPRVAVRLKGIPPNTRGIGAKLKLLGGVPMQSQEMICGGRYLSSDDAMRVFAAGSLTNEMILEVAWRSGKRSIVTNVLPDHVYEIDEAGAGSTIYDLRFTNREPRYTQHVSTLFRDVSELIAHTHHEEPFDDFALQPTLPRRLSQLGPGISWFDIDGDGWDDLMIGSGKGGQLAVFRNDGSGGFKRLAGPPWDAPVTRDQTTVLGCRTGGSNVFVFAGSANYEDGLTNGAVARRFNPASQRIEETLPGAASSAGPLALADVDGDGELDLFVGGRVLSGRYPEAASSLIFRGRDGGFVPDEANTKALAGVGLVSSAVFSDLDGDGDSDLVLACEWGPLRVFRNERGKLAFWDPPVRIPTSRASPLTSLTGWWNGVTTGDFDGDGRLDLAASNWGRNTRYEHFRAKPIQVYYGEMFPDGRVQVIEGHVDAATQRLLPLQPFHLMGLAMPALRERLRTFEAYAKSSLDEIYGDGLKRARSLAVEWLESTVFLNRGDHFEAVLLPVEAQLAPAFATCVADFDGDGKEDLVLSQNFFAVPADTPRYDAGRGLLLRGDGKGSFTAVPGQESGILVYGEQRGAAVCDYDGDGRPDLAMAQNGGATKLYRNAGGTPGLRVRIRGPVGNPTAIGATLRVISGGQAGPAREIHAGSGYWSQDSAVPLFSTTAAPNQIQVRWPGGQTTTSDLPPGAREVVIDPSGRLSVIR